MSASGLSPLKIGSLVGCSAQWLACTYPCRRFAAILTNGNARLGVDVVRYSFIVGDLHSLLLAGLPEHLCENSRTH
ncbi:hypothetical protein SBBP2_2420006 [Burkholderiales bacterium]|nr:hypothetical protein SBBP2_2420006 [Burkholderiales bacterium]